MSTFTLRDQRLLRVQAALQELLSGISALRTERDAMAADPNRDPVVFAALQEQLETREGWQLRLQSEQAVLQRSDWRVTDTTYQLILVDWLWSPGLSLADLIASDPVLLALVESPKFTSEFAASLAGLNLGIGAGPPPNLLSLIQGAANNRSELVDELAVNAHRLWLERADNTSPYDHVHVLLPLRMETIFKEVNRVQQLWIRLTPDEPSISRHRGLVSAVEREFLQEFWQQLGKALPNPPVSMKHWLLEPVADLPWRNLAARVSGPRAAWLVSNFEPRLDQGQPVIDIPPDQLGTFEKIKNQADELMALPTEIEIWAVHDPIATRERTLLGVLRPSDPVTGQHLLVRDAQSLRLPLPDESLLKQGNWLTDFESAKHMGLGGQLDLPNGVTQQSLRALFVVGQCETEPNDVFAAHAEAGTLGVIRLGTPTNTVHGAPATDLGNDPMTWLEVVKQRWQLPVPDPQALLRAQAFERAGSALTGANRSIPYSPVPVLGARDPVDDVLESVRFSRALWPALWGHFLRDHLKMLPQGTAVNANDAWYWAHEFLFPEGPLPPVRIHDQPYGLLPVTSLAQWSSADAEDEQLGRWEDVLIKGLLRLRSEMLAHSRVPNLLGADTNGILNVLGRDAVTNKYQYRYWMRFQFLKTFFRDALLPAADNPSALWSNNFHVPLGSIKPLTDSLHFAMGEAQYLDLPLIAARRRPRNLRLVKLFDELWRKTDWQNIVDELLRRIIPDSLCIRLMVESILIAQAWVGQDENRSVAPLINGFRWSLSQSVIQRDRAHFREGAGEGRLGRLVSELRNSLDELAEMLDIDLNTIPDPLAGPDQQGRSIWEMKFPPERLAQLERALRATLDTASHRIDPWVTGLAWRRLDASKRSSRQLYRTGVYGWLDGPFLGKPGPTDAGLMLAPSHAQAITSMVLRDKFLSTGGDDAVVDDANKWHMNIDSSVARKAMEFTEECRLGFHFFEVIGRQVEGIIGQFAAIRVLRLLRPLRPGVSDPAVVCHGLDALHTLLATSDPPEPGLVALRASLSEAQHQALRKLLQSVDAYADLMLADAVHHVVTGQPQRAADAMDAASGFGPAPSLDSIRTPPSGYRLQSTVLCAVPWIETPAFPAGPIPIEQLVPSRLAEPSLGDYLSKLFAQPANYEWQVLELRETDRIPIGSTKLSELGLSLVDAALVPHVLMADIVCAHLGTDPLPADLSQAQSPKNFQVIPPTEYFICRQLWGALANRPLGTDVLQTSRQLASAANVNQTERIAELQLRLESVRTGLEGLVTHVNTLLADAEIDRVFAKACLRQHMLWGLVPRLDPMQHRQLCQFVFSDSQPTQAVLRSWLLDAQAAAQQRIDRDPGASDQLAQIAKSIAELASSEGRMSILSKWDQTELLDRTGLQTINADEQLDNGWLTQIATVRPALARLEALQLQGGLNGTHEPLVAWTSQPGDPWQTAFVQAKESLATDFRLTEEPPHYFAGYGPANLWESTQLAVGLIDEYNESLPMKRRHAFAGFGFNAPASRAPQAILLAVPPQPRSQLSNDVLLQILIETRDSTHIRAIRPEDMTDNHQLISTMWFPASGSDRVRLDNDSQFWSFE